MSQKNADPNRQRDRQANEWIMQAARSRKTQILSNFHLIIMGNSVFSDLM